MARNEILHVLNKFIRNELIHNPKFSVDDLDSTYTDVVEKIVEYEKGNVGCLIFLDEEDQAFERLYFFGYELETEWRQNVKFGTGIVSEAIIRNQSLFTECVNNDRDYYCLCDETISQITYLLKDSYNKAYAVLAIEYNHPLPKKLEPSMLDAEKEYSDFFEQIEDFIAAHRLEQIFASIESIVVADGEKAAMERIVNAIKDTVGNGEVAILKRIGGRLKVIEFKNIQDDSVPNELEIGKGLGYTCLVAHSKIPFYCRDTGDKSRYPDYRNVVSTTKSQYTIPLIFRRELLGVLNVGAEVPYAFSSRDRKVLSLFAQHAAYALYNQRMSTEMFSISHTVKQRLQGFDFFEDKLVVSDKNDEYILRNLKEAINGAKGLLQCLLSPLREPAIEEFSITEKLGLIIENRISPLALTQDVSISQNIRLDKKITLSMASGHFEDVVENLLWNALESCRKLELNKNILVELFSDNLLKKSSKNITKNYVVLRIVNEGKLFCRDIYKTEEMEDYFKPNSIIEKSDKNIPRGIGIWACDRLLAHYGGYLDILQKDDNVVSSAFFPL